MLRVADGKSWPILCWSGYSWRQASWGTASSPLFLEGEKWCNAVDWKGCSCFSLCAGGVVFSRHHGLVRCCDDSLVFLSQKLTTVYRRPNVAIRIDWMRLLYSRYIVGRTRILGRRS